MKDLNAVDLDGAMKQIEGTARRMGIEVVGLMSFFVFKCGRRLQEPACTTEVHSMPTTRQEVSRSRGKVDRTSKLILRKQRRPDAEASLRRSSTKPSKCMRVLASILVRLTRPCVPPLSCHTAPARYRSGARLRRRVKRSVSQTRLAPTYVGADEHVRQDQGWLARVRRRHRHGRS